MVRVRKLVLAIAAATSLTSGMAHALGLGEVTLKSALNQPLQAEIELLDIKGLETDEVRPKLASAEDFAKAGVDRQFFLTDLKFTPALNANGKSVIRVTSSKPVREPYLNFMVEVLWPSGRLLREYTLLLDPPLYSPETAAAVAPQLPIATPVARPPAATAPRPAAAPASVPAAAPRPAPAGAAPSGAGGEYRTTSRDTLWEVAQQVRAGGSVHQAMLAIQDLNPEAFLGGNINRMKSGQVLRLPSDEQIRSRSQSAALAQVAAQNAAWREGRGAAPGAQQLDATRRSEAAVAPAQSEGGDNLRLVAPEAGSATSGSDTGGNGGGNSKALADKLAVTQESLDSARRESAELKGRVDDLQSQLDKLQRLIQLKDSQLAKLQASVAEQGQAPAAPAAALPPPAAAAATDGQPAAAQPPAATAQPGAAEQPGAVEQPGTAEPVPAENTGAPAPAAGEPAVPGTPAPGQAEEAVDPAAAAPAQPSPVADEPDEGALGALLANPTLLALLGGGALLLLLVALLILSRRNSAKETVQQNNLILGGDENSDRFDSDMGLGAGSFDSLDEDPPVGIPAAPSERTTPQTADPLGEADIYIAYGRFNQAAELLQGAINDEPQRTDLRLKLMEVYAELGDRNGFVRQENELREMGAGNADIDKLKLRYPAMSALAAAALAGVAGAASRDDEADEFNLDHLAIEEPAASTALDDDAFDLDDLDLDFETDASPTAKAAPADEPGDFSLEDDPRFAPASASATEQDLDFDLELDKPEGASAHDLSDALADFNLDLDEQDADHERFSKDDDFLFSLEDEPDVAAAEPGFERPQEPPVDPRSAVDMPLADFDLSLDDDAPAEDDFAAQLDRVAAQREQLSDQAPARIPAADEPFAAPFADPPSPAEPGRAEPELAGPDLAGPGDEDDFDFLSGTDETATKLDLARAYIDMGDSEGARDILDEVVAEGDDAQQQEARELISRLV